MQGNFIVIVEIVCVCLKYLFCLKDLQREGETGRGKALPAPTPAPQLAATARADSL